MSKPLADFIEEALRIVEEAKKQGISLRVMGATAFRLHCPKHLEIHKALGRELSDIDFVGYSKQHEKIKKLFQNLGYVMRPLTLAVAHLGARHIYIDRVNKRIVDVFLDKLVMCHEINFKGRLEMDYPTIPLAELLLQKMQIVKLTEKDVKDVIILLREHDIGASDKETVNVIHIAELLSRNWGFYYTFTTNLKKIKSLLPKYEVLTNEDKRDIETKIDQLIEVIEKTPKSIGWKLRARIGTSKKWYREVESLKTDIGS